MTMSRSSRKEHKQTRSVSIFFYFTRKCSLTHSPLNFTTGTVTDPDWNGRVKLRMNKTGETKSYLVHEVVLIREHDHPHHSHSPKPKHSKYHHHHHHKYHFNTAASGLFSFCSQCWYHVFCVGHSDHEEHDEGNSTSEDPNEWRKKAFFFGRVELTFRVVQALSLIQALFTLWSVLHFGEMLTVTPYLDNKLIISFGISALVLLVLISGFVMPPLFESYTLLQAWCLPSLGMIDECRHRVKSRETAVRIHLLFFFFLSLHVNSLTHSHTHTGTRIDQTLSTTCSTRTHQQGSYA